MASCELKNELAKLQEKKDKLANRAKNELALSELVLSGKELLSAEVELLKIALGDNIAKLAQAVSTEYITVKTANEGISHVDILSAIQKEISDMLVAIKNDKAVATKLEVLKIYKPDSKYMLLDLNLLAGADGKYTQMMLKALNGDVKTARRQELLQSQIDEAVKELNEIHGKVPKAVYDKKYDKYEELLKRQNGQALSDAMQAIPALTENKSDLVFPSIMALTESEKSKSSRGRALTKDEHTFSSVATVALDSNTIVGSAVKKGEAGIVEIDGTYEVSPLGLLLGHKSGSRSFDLPDYVKNTIKINALSHMDDIYKVLSYEVGSQEFNEAWGIDINTISEEEMALVQTKHIEGNIPQAVVLKSLGKAIYAGLPAKFAKNVDVELEQRAIVQLGLYAVRYMNAIGLVRLGESVTINGGSKTHIPVRANMSDEVVDGIVPASSIMNLVAELQHIGAAESRNSPRDVNEVHEVSQTIRNSFMETSETVRENLKAFENTEFKFNDHARLLYDMYTNNGKAGKEAAYAMAGVLSVDTSKPVIDQIKEMSKISYGKMQVDAFIEAYREFGLDGKPFKLPYDYTVSGRYMINSILNPQESKITRYLVSTKDIESVINVDTDDNGIKTLNAQDLDIFKLGVSQAFDRDPDKHSDIVALEDLEKVVSISRTGQVDFVKMLKNKDGTEYKNPFNVIYEALNNGSLNGESVIGEELKKALMAVNRAGAGFHAMQAIMALKQLNDATAKGLSEPVALSFSLESDAITSGMILTLMQIGTPKAMELAAKGGVYTKEALAKWEKLHRMYVQAANATDKNPIETLKQKDGSFKLTHGWLLDFTADISKRLENKEFVEAMYKQLEPRTQAYIQSQAKANGAELMSQAKETIIKISDFKDFYNTVAGSANAEMKKLRNKAESDAETLILKAKDVKAGSRDEKDLIKDAAAKSVEIALIDVVGDVTRKLAKPSVMVYIYGAMLSSIKKKMVDAVVMPKVYDIIKKVNSLYPDGLNYDGFIAFINSPEVVKNNFITQSEQIVLQTVFNGTAVQFKKLSGSTFINDDAKLMKNVIIPEKAAQKLAPATNETLGKAFETGFKAFGEIDSYRDSVKAAEVVRFTMFKYKLKQGLEKVKERLGDGEWRISAKDIASVIMQLEKDGFGHSVTDINGGRQPLYKKDDLEKAFITILAMDKYKPVSSAIEGKEYGPNTGASGVITVHNIDGFIDAVSAKAFDLVRIYDGSVSGINKMNESLEAYNDVVLQTTSWNSYVQQVKDLVNQIGKLEENGEIQEMLDSISDADRVSLLNTVQKLMGYGDIRELDIDEAISAKTKSVVDRVAAAEAFRNGGETELAIMHSYLTDSADMHIGKMAYGESNQLEPAAVGKLYEMYGNILHAIAGNDVNAEKVSEDKESYTNHSGGADGADIEWDKAGKKYGVTSNHYYMGEVGPKNAPFGNKEISLEDQVQGQKKVTAAAREMGRIWQTHQVRDTKLIRNWSQVKYSDQVVAITTMLSVGSEMNYGKKALIQQGKGGTGYAIQMAINEGKPVYVFDQVRNRWFKNIDGKWTNSDVPVLSKNFAGIGTRNINANGIQAINDAYEKTFMNVVASDSESQTKASTNPFKNSIVQHAVYHYSESGTIDKSLKVNKDEDALFFFKSLKSAQLLQEAINQGLPDATGKIFKAYINLVNPSNVDASDLSTAALIDLTIDAKHNNLDGIIARNMTEFFVGQDDQFGVFDVDNNVVFVDDQTDSSAKPFIDQHADNAKKIKDIMSDNGISEDKQQDLLKAADEKINEDCPNGM